MYFLIAHRLDHGNCKSRLAQRKRTLRQQLLLVAAERLKCRDNGGEVHTEFESVVPIAPPRKLGLLATFGVQRALE